MNTEDVSGHTSLGGVVEGFTVGIRMASVGALFLLGGYLFYDRPGWSLIALLIVSWMIFRWARGLYAPSMRGALASALTAWIPLMGLFWLRDYRMKSVGWENLIPLLPEYGALVIKWVPLFTMASLLSALGMALIGATVMPWRTSPRVERLREIVFASASACLVVFFAFFLFRLGWDFAWINAFRFSSGE